MGEAIKIKYDPKSFNYHFSVSPGFTWSQQLKAMQKSTRATLDALEKAEQEAKKRHREWQHKHIKWQMKYAIFLTIVGIVLLYTTLLRWNFIPEKAWPSDWAIMFNVATFWSMSCIIYRRRKEELKELFIDAL